MATVPGIGVEKIFCFVTLSEVDFSYYDHRSATFSDQFHSWSLVFHFTDQNCTYQKVTDQIYARNVDSAIFLMLN